MIQSLIPVEWGQGYPIGFPLVMHDANTIASAPRSTIIFARGIALFPGHPPQVTNPTISTGPVSLNAHFPSFVTMKSMVAGHISSVIMQRMIPIFI